MGIQTRIQEFKPKYLTQCKNLINTVLFSQLTDDQIFRMIEDQLSLQITALIGQTIIGIAFGHLKDDNKYYLTYLAVHPDFRRIGIGSKVLSALIGALQNVNAQCIELHTWQTNYEGIPFYQKKGFVIVEEIPNYYDDIDPPNAYKLVKILQRL